MRPRLRYACFVVSRIIIIRYMICHFWRTPAWDKVVLDKWFPLTFTALSHRLAPSRNHESGGWKCALVGVPWRGSASAWRDLFVNDMFTKVLKRLSILRHHGAPMMAHRQLPEGMSLGGWACRCAGAGRFLPPASEPSAARSWPGTLRSGAPAPASNAYHSMLCSGLYYVILYVIVYYSIIHHNML